MSVFGILYRPSKVVIDAPVGGGLVVNSFTDSSRQSEGSVAGMVIDATVSETHTSTCDVSENPVEEGPSISDHVQLNPAELTVEGVISDTPLGHAVIGNIQNLVRNSQVLFGGSSRSVDAYNDLLRLQKSRRPFTVITDLKRYQNMIITDLTAPRTEATGRALHFTAVMKEVFIVQSKEIDVDTSIPDLASSRKDNGQRVTNPVPQEDNIEQGERGSILADWFGVN